MSGFVASVARMTMGVGAIALATAAVARLAIDPPEMAAQATPAAAGQAAAGGADPRIAKGRDLFANWSCGSCHSLADAQATGHVGPAFDGDANLTEPFVIDRVTHGAGAMPSFGGQMTDEEIATIAFYVTHVRAK